MVVWLILAQGLILAEAAALSDTTSCVVMGRAFDPAWIQPGMWEQQSPALLLGTAALINDGKMF